MSHLLCLYSEGGHISLMLLYVLNIIMARDYSCANLLIC